MVRTCREGGEGVPRNSCWWTGVSGWGGISWLVFVILLALGHVGPLGILSFIYHSQDICCILYLLMLCILLSFLCRSRCCQYVDCLLLCSFLCLALVAILIYILLSFLKVLLYNSFLCIVKKEFSLLPI